MADYSAELQPGVSTEGAGGKKSRWAKWILIALVVVCLVLLLILILTFALKFNCSDSDSESDRDAKSDKEKGHEESGEVLKFLYISDFHLDPYYKMNVSDKDSCRQVVNATTAGYDAPYGRIGCDSPQLLVENTLKAMKYVTSGVEASFFLFTGTWSLSKFLFGLPLLEKQFYVGRKR